MLTHHAQRITHGDGGRQIAIGQLHDMQRPTSIGSISLRMGSDIMNS